MNVAIVYWSGTGNTEAMAQAIAEGVKKSGNNASLFTASDFDATQINSFDSIAFGCPAMGAEVLEENEFEPMFSSCEDQLNGKKIALFGSYGWGDGEWMRSWEERCSNKGIMLIKEGLICHENPDEEGLTQCRLLGEALSV
ncbi:MAG: flavodoxin [Spirochaetaceae bacterium]|nr:flavodoxin [Spirochaetaceae bacterium]